MNLKRLRESRGLTQTQLSSESGVAQGNISVYESGGKTPGMVTLLKLAKTLSCSIDELVYEDTDCRPKIDKGG